MDKPGTAATLALCYTNSQNELQQVASLANKEQLNRMMSKP